MEPVQLYFPGKNPLKRGRRSHPALSYPLPGVSSTEFKAVLHNEVTSEKSKHVQHERCPSRNVLGLVLEAGYRSA